MPAESQELKKVGLKVTLPRVKILQILESSDNRHMSAERHNFDGGHSVFELDRGDHHDHMVCIETGKVIEFHNDQIEDLQQRIAEDHGYEITGHSLVLYVKPK